MASVIKVEHVTKKFGGETVLEDICLGFRKGAIYGFVGRNGSGKTVLFKVIAGFIRPTSGRVLLWTFQCLYHHHSMNFQKKLKMLIFICLLVQVLQ